MQSNRRKNRSRPKDIWIISEGEYVEMDFSHIGKDLFTGPVKEFEISDIGRYMVNPYPIEVEEKLIGCEVLFHPPLRERIKEKLRSVLPAPLAAFLGNQEEVKPLQMFSSSAKKGYVLKDRDLSEHIEKISAMTRPYDSLFKELKNLDKKTVKDISGVYEDISGKCYHLNLQGSIDNKIEYLEAYLLRNVKIVMQKAYLADGLFEMKGCPMGEFEPGNSHRLIQITQGGAEKYFLIDDDNRIEFWVDDPRIVYYLHLLEQSIRINSKMKESFLACVGKKADPLKLFFSKQLAYDYSKGQLPKIYREALENHSMRFDEKLTLLNTLKNYQHTVSFHYIPDDGSCGDRFCTDISILHNLEAFESLKDLMPGLYSEIDEKVPRSEIGKFYLLDSMKGCQNEK